MMTTRFIKKTTWVLPGLIAMSQLSAASDHIIFDQMSSEGDTQLETEIQEQPLEDENTLLEPHNVEKSSETQNTPRTRFGIGYEFRQNLRSEVIERPDLPERPQRPERPDIPGRFGQ